MFALNCLPSTNTAKHWHADWDHYSLPGQLAEQVQHSHDDEEPIERLDIAI